MRPATKPRQPHPRLHLDPRETSEHDEGEKRRRRESNDHASPFINLTLPLCLCEAERDHQTSKAVSPTMVFFVDLESAEDQPPRETSLEGLEGIARKLQLRIGDRAVAAGEGSGSPTDGRWTRRAGRGEESRSGIRRGLNQTAMTKALACYPITMSIASHIDLNTLDALSSTCHQIRANLLQCRSLLMSATLHCDMEDVELLSFSEYPMRYRPGTNTLFLVEGPSEDDERDARLPRGRRYTYKYCARDLVGACQRCAAVVCRNCTAKPPSPNSLPSRLRRICISCTQVPSTSLQLCRCASTAPGDGVWLCQPCGNTLAYEDRGYLGVWKWRTRYLPSLGGLGTGIGDADRGVYCARGDRCVAAREVEVQVDCDAEDARDVASLILADARSQSQRLKHGGTSSGGGTSSSSSSIRGAGYARHEMEGIGGVVKRKLVKVVKVGACVPDEMGVADTAAGTAKCPPHYHPTTAAVEDRDTTLSASRRYDKLLRAEAEGRVRCLCGWCSGFVLSKKELAAMGVQGRT